MGFAVYAPMILARTGSNAPVFSSVQSAAAIGGVVGGLVIGAWGGFKRRVHGVLIGWALTGIGTVAIGLGQALPGWLIAGCLTSMLTPLINGSNQAIWQAKVSPDIQGRVFASRRLIAWLISPLGQMLAGPLADPTTMPRPKRQLLPIRPIDAPHIAVTIHDVQTIVEEVFLWSGRESAFRRRRFILPISPRMH